MKMQFLYINMTTDLKSEMNQSSHETRQKIPHLLKIDVAQTQMCSCFDEVKNHTRQYTLQHKLCYTLAGILPQEIFCKFTCAD